MNYLELLIERYPELSGLYDSLESFVGAVLFTHSYGGKILLAGNGGSAADCEHISGELLKGFIECRFADGEDYEALYSELGEDAKKLQRGICTVPLPSLSSLITAYSNDVDASLVFAQLVYSLGRRGDLLVLLSTSGNSENVVKAARAARALGITVASLTGEGGGKLRELSDILITAPASETYRVQEYHLPIYHALCAEVERRLFK